MNPGVIDISLLSELRKIGNDIEICELQLISSAFREFVIRISSFSHSVPLCLRGECFFESHKSGVLFILSEFRQHRIMIAGKPADS